MIYELIELLKKRPPSVGGTLKFRFLIYMAVIKAAPEKACGPSSENFINKKIYVV